MASGGGGIAGYGVVLGGRRVVWWYLLTEVKERVGSKEVLDRAELSLGLGGLVVCWVKFGLYLHFGFSLIWIRFGFNHKD